MPTVFRSYRIILLFFIIGTLIFGGLTLFLIVKEKNSPQKQLEQASPYQKQIAQLDSLLISIEANSQIHNQYVTKRDLEVPAEETKAALARGDIESARKSLQGFKAAVRELGDLMKGKFIPKDVRDKIDPQGIVLKNTDRVDPAVMDLYLVVVQMELALLGK